MNGPDQFEERLRRQPLRPLPADWRESILSAARAATKPSPAPRSTRSFFLSTINHQLSTLLWPHPKAWAALGAAWLVVLAFSLAAREPAPQHLARETTRPSPQLRALLREQERLLVELVGPMEKPAAERPKPIVPPPRSQRRESFLNT